MAASLSRRSKVLLALVASMTLGSGLLLGLQPAPMRPLSLVGLDEPRMDAGLGTPSAEPAPAAAAVSWQRMIIHESGQAADSVAEMDRRYERFGGCIYHFVINPDGSVDETTRWRRQQPAPAELHGGRPDGIHIALVGAFDRNGPTSQQYQKLGLLTKWLAKEYGMSLEAIDAKPLANRPGRAFQFERVGS